ncbi:MAG: SRPBCC family protein [Planctomycetota bacterium]
MSKRERPKKVRTLETEVWLASPLETVFEFFSDAHNLERLTPPILRFNVLTPKPIPMSAGTIIDYKLSLRGIPIRWKTLISAWEPPHRFVDTQLVGPYMLWHHEHTFEAVDGGTLCRDIVHYRHAATWLGEKLLIRNDIRGIFEHRQKVMLERFGSPGATKPEPDHAVA